MLRVLVRPVLLLALILSTLAWIALTALWIYSIATRVDPITLAVQPLCKGNVSCNIGQLGIHAFHNPIDDEIGGMVKARWATSPSSGPRAFSCDWQPAGTRKTPGIHGGILLFSNKIINWGPINSSRLVVEQHDLIVTPPACAYEATLSLNYLHPIIGFPLILLVIFASRHLIRHLRQTHVNTCLHCGYDLRATPLQCPECGRIRPAVSTSYNL